MILIDRLEMRFPLPRRYRDYLLTPFARPEMKTVLRDITIEIRDGERVGFLGPNGAGKTTLLKLIVGLLLPSAGSVVIDGCDTVRYNDRARRNTSLVMNEERSFYWRLTGRQNLEFFGALENLSGRKLIARISETLGQVGLSDSADRMVGTYSSGMKQRLAIARGLLSEPSVLILDEPTRALDPEGADELTALILRMLESGMPKTLLIATHRLEEAKRLCGRLCVISRGTVTADTPIEQADLEYGSLLEFYRTKVSV